MKHCSLGGSELTLINLYRCLPRNPYRFEPQLHLYAGLLVIYLCAIGLPCSEEQRVPIRSGSNAAVHEAFIPASLFHSKYSSALSSAAHHFQNVISTRTLRRVREERHMLKKVRRERVLDQRAFQPGSSHATRRRAVNRKRARDSSTEPQAREAAEETTAGEESDAAPSGNERADDSDEEAVDGEHRAGFGAGPLDAWAEHMAKAYLEMVRC